MGKLGVGRLAHRYAADPAAHIWDAEDRMYVYASWDNPEAVSHDSMDRYHVYSSVDLVAWVDHGMVLHLDNVSWAVGKMWAPDAVHWNGKYYLVFCALQAQPDREPIFRTGLAVAGAPAGPFEDIGFIQGVEWGQDPCLFVDDDDTPWLFWGLGGYAYVVQLTDDLLHAVPDTERNLTDQLPAFYEGPWAFKRGGVYYLMYPTLHHMEEGERLEYATAHAPQGPWTPRGLLMNATSCWTNHGSIVEFRGRWYLFYHTDALSGGLDHRRSVAVEPLTFLPDGSILPITPTVAGVPRSLPLPNHAQHVKAQQRQRAARAAAMRRATELAAAEAAAAVAEAVRLRSTRHRHPALEDRLPKVTLQPGVVVVPPGEEGVRHRCRACQALVGWVVAVLSVVLAPWTASTA